MGVVMSTGPSLIEAFVKAAQGVSTQWSLAAFAIAALLAVVWLSASKGRQRTAAGQVWGIIVGILVLALTPILARTFGERVYRVRATVVDRRNLPVDDARVWSDVGG